MTSSAVGPDDTALRVLIASSVYPPKIGGPASQAQLFARELDRRGVQVRVLTYGPAVETKDGVDVEYLDCSTARGTLASLRRSLLVARQVNRLFKTFRPHVVQMQTPTGVLPLTVGVLARLNHTPSWVKFAADPVFQLLHERTPTGGGSSALGMKLRLRAGAIKTLAKLVFRTYRFAWATSPAVASELKQRWGVSEKRIVTAPNLVDLRGVGPRDGIGDEEGTAFGLLMVTRLQKQKGIDVAIRALAELGDPRFILRVVGEGDEKHAEELRRLARQLEVADRVDWAGKVAREQLPDEYRRASLLLVPSRYEPFGIVLIEAMASGLPIVATNVGGIPYVVDGGVCARLVEPDDAPALARAIGGLVADDGEMRRLRAAGLNRALEFDAAGGVGKWLDIYREELSKAQQSH